MMMMMMIMMMMNCFMEYSTRKMSLTVPLPVPHLAGDNTDLPSNTINISKTARVNIAFLTRF